MASYIGGRLAAAVITLLGLMIIVFLLIQLVPGDPARTLLGPEAPPESVAALRHEWGLDRSVVEQLALSIGRFAQGSFGTSFIYDEPAGSLILSRIWPTLVLLLVSLVFIIIVSCALAIPSALREDKATDHVVRVATLVSFGVPSIWVSIVLLELFAVRLGLFPIGGYPPGFLPSLHALILPAVTITLAVAPIIIRNLRAALIDALGADYIATARMKGLSEWRTVGRHALPNAALPIIALGGVRIGWLVGNTMVVEKVFGIPGMGALFIDSIVNRDFPVVQGIAFVVGVLVIFISILTDVIQVALDPRVRPQ